MQIGLSALLAEVGKDSINYFFFLFGIWDTQHQRWDDNNAIGYTIFK